MNPNRSLSNFQDAVYQYTYNVKKASGVCLQNTTDYSPFGVTLDGRTMQGDGYRYGFGGLEKTDELKGSGNQYTTLFREYDPRLGRWLSLDPAMAKYPGQSPYVAFNNNPIFFTDPFGDDPPEGFKKHTGQGGRDVFLPESAQTSSTENCGTGVQELTSFTIGSKTFDAQYDDKGGFTGYFNGTDKYENPDISLRSGSSIFGGALGSTLNATFDITNVPADGFQVIQVFAGTGKTSDSSMDGIARWQEGGLAFGGEVDGGVNSLYAKKNGGNPVHPTMPYYLTPSEISSGVTYNSATNSGSIRVYDRPNSHTLRKVVRFETIIIATNYMGSGKDVMLGTIKWEWNNGVSSGGLNLTTPGAKALEIINIDYPTYKFFGQ
jgi:RHS repeat-associated protein